MDRRGFLASLCAAIIAPFVPHEKDIDRVDPYRKNAWRRTFTVKNPQIDVNLRFDPKSFSSMDRYLIDAPNWGSIEGETVLEKWRKYKQEREL